MGSPTLSVTVFILTCSPTADEQSVSITIRCALIMDRGLLLEFDCHLVQHRIVHAIRRPKQRPVLKPFASDGKTTAAVWCGPLRLREGLHRNSRPYFEH